MQPPSEQAPTIRRSSVGKIVAGVMLALVTGAVFVDTAANPARLLSQARYIGPASRESVFHAPAAKNFMSPCPECKERTSVSGNDSSDYTSTCPLPDWRRGLTLGIRGTPDRHIQNPSDAPRELVLTSDDSPESKVVLMENVPREMRSLVGVSNDGLLVTSSAAPPEGDGAVLKPPSSGSVTLIRFGIVGSDLVENRAVAKRPGPGSIRAFALSRNGRRILWAIRSERKPYAIAAWAARSLHSLDQYGFTRDVLTLWETDADGKQAIEIGTELQPLDDGRQKSVPVPGNFAYQADDRHIRFDYGSEQFEIASPVRP